MHFIVCKFPVTVYLLKSIMVSWHQSIIKVSKYQHGIKVSWYQSIMVSIAPDKAAYCVFTQFLGPENAIKFISVRTKTQ